MNRRKSIVRHKIVFSDHNHVLWVRGSDFEVQGFTHRAVDLLPKRISCLPDDPAIHPTQQRSAGAGRLESEEATHLQGLVKAELEADARLVARLDTGPVDVEQHCKQKTVHCWPSLARCKSCICFKKEWWYRGQIFADEVVVIMLEHASRQLKRRAFALIVLTCKTQWKCNFPEQWNLFIRSFLRTAW